MGNLHELEIVIMSLAAVLALAFATAVETPFLLRSEIILISVAVILATLVGQGLTLAPLIRLLHLEEEHELEGEETRAREHAATAALTRLDQLAGEDWLRAESVERLRLQYSRRVERLAKAGSVDEECSTKATAAFQQLWYQTLTAERLALIALRNDGTISDEVLYRLEHELSVEALRVGIGERPMTASARADRVSITPASSA